MTGFFGFGCFVFLFCFACSAAVDEVREEAAAPAPAGDDSLVPEGSAGDVASRELTDAGYVIRYNGRVYGYPLRVSPVFVRDRPSPDNPTDTNTIETGEEDRRRPLFYFTTYEPAESPEPKRLPAARPYIEIRRKRDVGSEDVPESSKVGKLRRKRTYCRKCGGYGGYGGYGVSYIPVTYAVYPVYPSYYGGGKGCNTCGGQGGYGGGGGGSFSYSSSSSQSSAGSFGWGK